MLDYKIGRLNGRFVVTWKDESGNRHRYRLQATTARAADAEARDVLITATADPNGVTVANIWEAYRAEYDGRSIAESMRHTGKSVLPWFGHFRPDQITVDDCRAYIADRRADGRHDGTIWTQLGHLRNALSWAHKRGLIARAPYIERPSQPAPKDRYLTHAEIDRLLAADCAPHIRLSIILMLTTAARVGALLELTWDGVDLERGHIVLRTEFTGPRKGRATPPINDLARAALTTAREAALSPYVIEWGGRQVKSIKRGFAAACTAANLDDVSPHTLRHTAAVHMAAAGVPMARISQYLGHSNTQTTERVYARFAPDHLRDAAEVLNFGRVRGIGGVVQ
ncbi:MAG: site-specific integrase [Betaproteobacteria bacterium]|nr:site-specific integrase [Betaproteobacteria bacterium]